MSIYKKREMDWRNGAIIYQIIVDRFAQPLDLEAKKDLYHPPKVLRAWDELPKPGHFNKDVKYWSHELDFWGGDLASVMTKLDYLRSLDIDVLYLNPIFESVSNHKYDATNYEEISKEFGTHEDLNKLSHALHKMHKKLVLDGVFNHVGIGSELFKKAMKNESEYRAWFDFNPKYSKGVRLWADVDSLPELNLENQAVRDYLYQSKDSIIRRYIKTGIDGWRLDVAFDLGFKYLKELTDAAHEEKNGSLIVGEIWNYPKDWLKSIDGVMNFTLREIILKSVKEEITPAQAQKMITFMIEDSGIEGLLKSWNIIDNHDVPRINFLLPQFEKQKLAQVLQFTLPGSPNLYYGSELGMKGGFEPLNRAPMQWSLLSESNQVYQWTKSLIRLHQMERALKIGDYLGLISEKLIAYERYTDQVEDTILVIMNLTSETVEESILIPDSKLMNYSEFQVLLGESIKVNFIAGLMTLTLPPSSFVILKPVTRPKDSYTSYKRV